MKVIKLNEDSTKQLIGELSRRSPSGYPEQERVVSDIIANIRQRGDEALFEYIYKFDKARLDAQSILVTKAKMDDAYNAADPKMIEVIKRACANIKSFHEKQRQNSWFTSEDGIFLGQKLTPLERVGVYVPGGKAALSSSVLMNVIPAKVAQVGEVIMCTPCASDGSISPYTLVAAGEAGVDKIFKVGGAQAIAAMAFGTGSVPRVDKITGPGNIYVALAKKAVFGHVSIDSIAGPSEILILADDTANAKFVAADLLSQAEHDEMASAILVTTSKQLAVDVQKWIKTFTSELERRDIIEKSLEDYGYIFITDDMEKAIDAVNLIASEHLEIVTRDPLCDMTKIKNAGAIFLGTYACEPLGDYFAGPNHILPTGGTARFFSPLSVDDFVKKSSVISYSKERLREVYQDAAAFADIEGLSAHANSLRVRFE